jgi:hypothetical protein
MTALVHINGRPGVGKLTVARELAGLIGARVIDNHSIYNVGLSLTVFKSEAFYAAVRGVRAVAAGCVRDLLPATPVIVTNAHFHGSDWGRENWDFWNRLAGDACVPLAVVVLECDRAENIRRIQDPSRIGKGALRDPAVIPPAGQQRALLDDGGDFCLHLDTTEVCAHDTAVAIASWLTAARGSLQAARAAPPGG